MWTGSHKSSNIPNAVQVIMEEIFQWHQLFYIAFTLIKITMIILNDKLFLVIWEDSVRWEMLFNGWKISINNFYSSGKIDYKKYLVVKTSGMERTLKKWKQIKF